MRVIKKIFFIIGIGIAVMAIAVLVINFYVGKKSGTYIFQEINDLPKAETALVLGAKVYQHGTMSGMFQDRVDTAIELYKEHKVEKILVSGDHGKEDYDEVNTAKDYLMEKGVRDEDIFLDHAGFDTYDSLYRAKEIFEVSSVIIVTQNFHLPRALYIGRELGIEVYGFSTDKHLYAGIKYNELREIFGKVKAFLDVSFHAKPKFLGEKIPIIGDSKKSWDENDIILDEDKINEINMDEIDKVDETDINDEADRTSIENEISKETIKEKNVLLDAPFISQAPFGNWSDPRKQDGCEEAMAIMAMAWVNGERLTPQIADKKIDEISAYEEKMYGSFHDTNAQDTAQRIFREFFKYDNIKVKHDITKEDIKQELFKGNLVIVPTDGQLLNNPNYTPPGPTTHNLVVIGYDISTNEFITNDPGTRRGEKYHYDENILESALLDYPTGNHEKIEEIITAMIVIFPK
jgi:SanA protein